MLDVDIAPGYKLVFNDLDDTYYCLKDNQTSKLKQFMFVVFERIKYLELNDVSKPFIPP